MVVRPNLRLHTIPLFQMLLSCCAVVLALWIKMPWPGVAALAGLAAEILSAARSKPASRRRLITAWLCTLIVMAGALVNSKCHIDFYCAIMAWLIAAALFATSISFPDAETKKQWRKPALAWAFAGGLAWLTYSYSKNLRAAFHFGLVMVLAVLILSQFILQMRQLAIHVVNTLILLAIGLPVVDLFIRPRYRADAEPDPRRKYYAYDIAKKAPGAFAVWNNYYLLRLSSMQRHIFVFDPGRTLPSGLKPSCHFQFFQSDFSINSNGFRGREFSPDKGNAYRIVALGESTTFGITLTLEDKPWPELLEQIIRDRLKPSRPVEIINAGVPSWDIKRNLARLEKVILPLKPDIIISYHGFN